MAINSLQVCFGWARLSGGLRERKSAGRGPISGLSAARVLGGVIGRKHAGRGISVFGSLAPEAGSFNQTHAFVGVEAT